MNWALVSNKFRLASVPLPCVPADLLIDSQVFSDLNGGGPLERALPGTARLPGGAFLEVPS